MSTTMIGQKTPFSIVFFTRFGHKIGYRFWLFKSQIGGSLHSRLELEKATLASLSIRFLHKLCLGQLCQYSSARRFSCVVSRVGHNSIQPQWS